jgi:Tfp pilus assembly protein PilO
MTFADEFMPSAEGEQLEEAPNYPTAFGITFTPKISGIALAVLGVVGCGYLVSNMVLPAYAEYQKSEQTKKEQLELKERQKIEVLKIQQLQTQLQQTQAIRPQILALFADEKNVDTLLLDISRLFESSGAKLNNFQPVQAEPEVISDGSLGTLVNGKLKRLSVSINMEGTFEQTQGVLRDLERLQSLTIVRNFNSQRIEPPALSFQKGKLIPAVSNPNKLRTSFTLDVILPLSPEEVAAAAPPPPEQAAPK